MARKTILSKAGAAIAWLAGHRLFALGFCVAVAFVPWMMSPSYTPRWAAMVVLLPLCSQLDPRAVPLSLRWVLLWVLTLGFMATTWASPDPMGGYLEMMFMVMLCLAFVVGANLDSLDEVINGLAAGLAVSVFIALYQLSAASDEGRDGLIGAAPTGLFGNSEPFAEFAALIFVWAAVRRRLDLIIVSAAPLLWCQSRLSLFVALAGLLYAYGPKTKLRMTLALAGLIAVGGALLVMFGTGKMASMDHRIVIWLATIAAWTQFGHGFGWFQASHPAEEFAHSDALQAVAEIGIGALALLAIPVMAFVRSRGSNNAERALFVAVCIEICFSFPLHMPATGFVAAIVAGFLVSRRPVVCLGRDVVGSENVIGLRRAKTSGARIIGDGAGFGGPLPVRSVQPASPEIRGAVHRFDPAAAKGT